MFALEDLKLFNEADMPKVKSAAARWSPPNLKSSPKIKIQVMYFLNNYIKKNTKLTAVGSNVWNFSTEQ